jgi:PAS domain S-box-containing protein
MARSINPPGSPAGKEDILHRKIFLGIRLHHLILTAAFLLLVALGVYFIMSESDAVKRTAISSYQETELEIVRDAARSTREYVYVQTIVLNRTDISTIEQEIFRKFIAPIHLLENGDAWIYAPDHVVFDLSSDFPDEYRGKSMAQIFALQKDAGASHYEAMTADVTNAREGVGYYIWLPEKGQEIAAWTPVTVGNYTWTIGLSTPLPEILEATGATARTRNSSYILVLGIGIALVLFLSWLRADIQRSRSDEILYDSEARYSAMVNNAPGPVLVLRGSVVQFINDAGVQASGFARDEILKKNILEFLTEDSRKITRDAMERRRAGAEHVSEYEIGFIRKDGIALHLMVRAIDITYLGEPVTLALLVDITERKRADEALKMANKKLNLLSGITRHDIKNQLLVLHGFIDLSRRTLDNPVRTAEFIQKEIGIVRTITSLIAFTKEYENLGVNAPAWQNVSALIERILPQLPVRNIRIDAGDRALEVFADPLLERVFYNLLDNALRYGGSTLTAIRVTHRTDSGKLVIIVEDNGAGIRAEDREKLFTKGFGRNTGLGLFLSREILAITRITIAENGEYGTGARFEITVPEGMYRFSA